MIIGGSFAGLSAALYLGRARRSVVVVDGGKPRNRFAHGAHGLFGHDGRAPADILAAARSQVAVYPTASVIEGVATQASRKSNGFTVTLASGEVIGAARLILAYGVSDDLPSIPGLAERWGRSVIHCPYCHGYEFSDQRLGVLYTMPESLHQATLVAEWGPTTLFLNGAAEPDDDSAAELRARGIAIEPAPVRALRGDGERLSSLELEGDRRVGVDALYVGPRTRLNSDIAQELGCALDEGSMGAIVRTDDAQATSVDGVYAAGDITRFANNLTWASASGIMAALAVHRSFVFGAPEPVGAGR